MDIYLNWDNEEKSMLLPVNPSGFEIAVRRIIHHCISITWERSI